MVTRPPKLRRGDVVAAISLSSGAAEAFPQVYGAAKRTLSETFGLELISTPHALKSDNWLYEHSEARADDLHWALTHPGVQGIFSTIGGYESVRVLPFIDPKLIRANPKVLLGFSDTSVTHLAFLQAGVASVYGPSLMAGFADTTAEGYEALWLDRLLFSGWTGDYAAAAHWTEDNADWAAEDFTAEVSRPKTQHSGGWQWLQGSARAQGTLWGAVWRCSRCLRAPPTGPRLNCGRARS